MLVTTDKGVCTLAASCRAFARTRQRSQGHNINQIMNFFFGNSPDTISSYQITDFLSTTKWRPSAELLKLRDLSGRAQCKLSPPLEELLQMFPGIPLLEITPLIWSAGFLVHPDFVQSTKRFQKKKELGSNATLSLFGWMPSGMASSLSSSYGRLARGQVYTDVMLNIYKRPGGLCLSSFESFNIGNAGFQQFPWCANLDGLGVWSESGLIGGGIMKFQMTNSHSPNIVQRGGLLVCSYAAPQSLQSSIFCSSAKMWSHIIWPGPAFDRQALYVLNDATQRYDSRGKNTLVSVDGPSWRIASRNECYIGIGCMQACTVTPATDASNGVKMTFHGEDIYASRITCETKYSTFVVIVASHDEFDGSYSAFVDRCLSVRCTRNLNTQHSKSGSNKVIAVRIDDEVEGIIDVETTL